jgi:hypothetical protein
MAIYEFQGPESAMAKVFGPNLVQSRIDEAIFFEWLVLPEDKKSMDNLEAEIRRLVDESFQNLRKGRKRLEPDDPA